jgi:putative PIG3 family NAD(P)H quinone oxidoreductase
LQRQGRYPPPPGASDIPGLEVAGEVVALGPGAGRWKIGDKVCALLSGGGYAEYVNAPAVQCLPIPEGLTTSQAAALPECAVTVWANVFETAGLQPGESVLVHGGASGIGTTAIQMVKANGSHVFVTVGSEQKAEACRKLEADLAVNYTTHDFVKVIQDKTQGRGVDVVLDMIGGDYVPRNLTILSAGGRHVSIATQKGTTAIVDLRQIMLKRLIVTGSTLRGRSAEEKGRLVRHVEEKVWPWIGQGNLNPLIYNVVPIQNVAEAHKMMESGAHMGKIILEVSA